MVFSVLRPHDDVGTGTTSANVRTYVVCMYAVTTDNRQPAIGESQPSPAQPFLFLYNMYSTILYHLP